VADDIDPEFDDKDHKAWESQVSKPDDGNDPLPGAFGDGSIAAEDDWESPVVREAGGKVDDWGIPRPVSRDLSSAAAGEGDGATVDDMFEAEVRKAGGRPPVEYLKDGDTAFGEGAAQQVGDAASALRPGVPRFGEARITDDVTYTDVDPWGPGPHEVDVTGGGADLGADLPTEVPIAPVDDPGIATPPDPVAPADGGDPLDDIA
jgi:hypothetical protein